MRRFRKYFEKFFEGSLFLSSTVTTIAVLFIIVFLFKEGLGIFQSKPIEHKHIIAVNKGNNMHELTSRQIKDIFNQDITNWNQLGGANDTILLLSVDELGYHFTEEELGADFENIPQCINSYVEANSGVIAYLPTEFIDQNFKGKEIPVANVSVGEFFKGREWIPTASPTAQFGVLPLILGTLWVSIGAIFLALPIGLITAIYMAEVASPKFRNFLKPLIELLAGIPSVVYGFFGLVVLVPLIQNLFNLPVGETALAGSIILAIMALPTIITISEDAIRTTPVILKEASLALGATKMQTIFRVIIPYAKSGITAASILGIGRAMGETMAVLMVTGNASVMPKTYLDPVRTIPATIAAELGEAPHESAHYKALFALGIILFLITFSFNLIVRATKRKYKQ